MSPSTPFDLKTKIQRKNTKRPSVGSKGRSFSCGGYSDAQRIKRKVKVHGHDTDESQRSNSHGLPPANQLTCSAARCRRRYKYTHAGLCMSRRRHGNAHNTQNMTTPRPACRPPHAGTNIVFSMKKKKKLTIRGTCNTSTWPQSSMSALICKVPLSLELDRRPFLFF